ncbi:helicase associated domain-containing protein [Streptomyces sp. NBC_00433]
MAWQRRYRLCRGLIEAGTELPTDPGQITLQGEDLGAWVQAQRLGWDQLLPARAWMLENMLPLSPAGSERPSAARTQNDEWALNISGAAKEFHAREGSLQTVPRKAVVQLSEPDGRQTTVKLGLFIGNCRRRADKLTSERRAELDALGMRW